MEAEMYTSCYKHIENDIVNDRLVSISGDRGKKASYSGDYFRPLMPKKEFFNIWHNNIGKISEVDNTKFYIKEYYDKVLSKLDPECILKELKGKILLCYEDNASFCHRHIVAYWIELLTGKAILEIQVLANGKIKRVERPKYLKDIVEEVLRDAMNVSPNKSLESAYLIQKAENLENCSIKAIDDDDMGYSSHLLMLAEEMRRHAVEVNKRYILSKKKTLE